MIISPCLFESAVRHALEMSPVEVKEFEEFRTRWDIVAIAVKLRPLQPCLFIKLLLQYYCQQCFERIGLCCFQRSVVLCCSIIKTADFFVAAVLYGERIHDTADVFLLN